MACSLLPFDAGIIWNSHLTEEGRADRYLDKDKYIIQIWTSSQDPLAAELIEKGFRVIFSNYDAWYLDCGFGAWVGEGNNWCSPYKGWQAVYDNNPLQNAGGAANAHQLVLGGEGALWSEQVTGSTMDAKVKTVVLCLIHVINLYFNLLYSHYWNYRICFVVNLYNKRIKFSGLSTERTGMLRTDSCSNFVTDPYAVYRLGKL